MGVTIKLDESKIKEMEAKLKHLSRAEIEKAVNRAAKRAADSGKTAAKRALKATYTHTKEMIDESLSTEYNSGVGAALRAVGSPVAYPKMPTTSPNTPTPAPMVNGKFTGQAAAQTVHVKKANPVAVKNKWFVARVKTKKAGINHVGVFERTGEKTRTGKERLEQHFAPSIPNVITAHEVREPVVAKIEETMDKRLNHEIERLLK